MNKQNLFPSPKIYSIIAWCFILFSLFYLVQTCTSMFSKTIEDININRVILQVSQCLFCFIAVISGYQIKSNVQELKIKEEEDLFERIKERIPYFKSKNSIRIKSIWDSAKKDVANFRFLIFIIWISWGVYFAYSAIFKPFSQSILEVPFEVLFNNISFIAFFACYTKLNSPSAKVIKEKIAPWIIAMVAIFFIHSVVLRYKIIDAELIDSFFLLASGVLNSFSIAVFLGRIESKNISPPRFYVWVMFFYAALQPLIIISSFGETDVMMTEGIEKISKESMMVIANIRLWLLAVGKGVFFLFTLWLFESKRLIYYFMVTPEVKKSTDAFNEIQKLI
jgi:hypothetical protein